MIVPEHLYTAEEIAKAMNLTKQTIHRMGIPSYYLAKQHYYLGKDVIDHIAKNGKAHNNPSGWGE